MLSIYAKAISAALLAITTQTSAMTLDERIEHYKKGIVPMEEKTVHLEFVDDQYDSYIFCFIDRGGERHVFCVDRPPEHLHKDYDKSMENCYEEESNDD